MSTLSSPDSPSTTTSNSENHTQSTPPHTSQVAQDSTSSITSTPNLANGSGLMFDQIAKRYDLLNRLISLGLDQSWRKALVASLPTDGEILDVATGTADVALAIAKKYHQVSVVGLDPSVNMLDIGKQKVIRKQWNDRISLMVGDAMDMSFDNNRFAGSCVAFGVRNFPNRLKGMQEMNRVTQAGGKVSVLELSEPRDGLLAPFVRFHVHHIVPWMGAILSGNAQYRYLQKSVEAFPPASEFKELMQEAGIEDVQIHRMPFGVAHLYVGTASHNP